jgi:predicted ATP-grasp superfamily ATP-dependent carboligase
MLSQGAIPGTNSLLPLARDFPGAVVLPTSDGTMFWAARNREALGSFRTALPCGEAVYALLNKRLLAEECRKASIDTGETIAVLHDRELPTLPSLRYPVLVKPQTRVGQGHWLRGIVARNEDELRSSLCHFWETVTYTPEMVAYDPLINAPLVQEYHESAMAEIYHLAGYIDASGELAAVRARRKILQFPRRMGNAACSVPAPVDEALRDRLLALCRQVGYFGIFEAEFIPADDRRLLIDFNPRPYNGMALEIARGLDLPWLAYLEAIGDRDQLRQEIERANREPFDEQVVFCRQVPFHVLTAGQLLSGGMSWREFRRWRRWYRRHRDNMVDQFSDPDDPWLGRLYALSMLITFVRNPAYLYGTFIKRP